MERCKMLPIGIENFAEIISQGFYYVDKTLLIKDLLTNWGKVNLFTRPRRFGKSLNMSMLKSFFEIGADPALFDGLAITDEKELCDAYMGKYPVVSISLKTAYGLSFEEAKGKLLQVLSREVDRQDFLFKSTQIEKHQKEKLLRIQLDECSDLELQSALKLLTDVLYKHYGQKVVLLIDEYDVPLEKSVRPGSGVPSYYDRMINLIRSMFDVALKSNDSLQFAVLTGCLRVSKESIFTGLNNLKVNSITSTRFDEYFGFIDKEIDAMLSYYGLIQHRETVKEWYDGYLFGGENVYCPWDVINFCDDLIEDGESEPKLYWLNSSGNDAVRELINQVGTELRQDEIEDLIAGQTIRKAVNEQLTHNELYKQIDNLWSLLYMTGYLTITNRPQNGIYDLVIPNREVRSIFEKQVMEWFAEKSMTQPEGMTELFHAFECGDCSTIKDVLDRKMLDAISYHDEHETFYHGFLLALILTCGSWAVRSNAETGKGRSDISVERKDRAAGFVVEVKYVKEMKDLYRKCDAAIAQIEDMKYYAPQITRRIPNIWVYGITFCGKECMVKAKHVVR